jgi:hypothetical protein
MDYQGSIWSGFHTSNRVLLRRFYFAIENKTPSKIDSGGVLGAVSMLRHPQFKHSPCEASRFEISGQVTVPAGRIDTLKKQRVYVPTRQKQSSHQIHVHST